MSCTNKIIWIFDYISWIKDFYNIEIKTIIIILIIIFLYDLKQLVANTNIKFNSFHKPLINFIYIIIVENSFFNLLENINLSTLFF